MSTNMQIGDEEKRELITGVCLLMARIALIVCNFTLKPVNSIIRRQRAANNSGDNVESLHLNTQFQGTSSSHCQALSCSPALPRTF